MRQVQFNWKTKKKGIVGIIQAKGVEEDFPSEENSMYKGPNTFSCLKAPKKKASLAGMYNSKQKGKRQGDQIRQVLLDHIKWV